MKIHESIVRTVCFFDIFDFPLTAEEVLHYLYKKNRAVHIKEVQGELGLLVESGKLELIHDYYVLKGRGEIVDVRRGRKFTSEKFWERTRFYTKHMKWVPFIGMMAVCNNLAYNNASEQSDIDLLVVVKPGRMWTARLFLTTVLHFYGVRRYGDKVAGRFCLSFFITPSKMKMADLELAPEDPYLAYWTKTLAPVFGTRIYHLFQQANEDFLKKYGLMFDDEAERYLLHEKKSLAKRFWEGLLGGWLGDLLEALLKRTLKKKTLAAMESLGSDASVVVTDDMLKFHNHDKRKEYYEKWKKASA